MILEEATFEAFGYEVWELTSKDKKPIWAACELCGKFRVLRRYNYRTFCRPCSHLISGKSKRKKHTARSKTLISKNHADVSGSSNPAWNGGTIRCVCLQCKKEFYVVKSRIKKGEGKYCCKSCAPKTQRRKAHPRKTAPEKIFEGICIKNNLPFKFVGDGSLWVGNANPDFVHTERKIAVEVFGNYWHSPLLRPTLRYNETVEGRREQLEAQGYKLIVFWELDLMHKDADKFVLRKLKKEGEI